MSKWAASDRKTFRSVFSPSDWLWGWIIFWLWFVSQSALKTNQAGSFDSLSDAIDASKPLKSMIEVKQLGKNFMKSNWKKYWAVLQNNSLYIYYDKTETAMVQVRIQSSSDRLRDPRTIASDSGTRWFRVVPDQGHAVRGIPDYMVHSINNQ